jgi:predicted lysophospholipase L1 biosynthesis ABC-type transport system permease subunit
VGANGGQANVLLGNAFYRAHVKELTAANALGGQPALVVRLAEGEPGATRFERLVQPIYGGQSIVASASQDDEAVLDTVNVQRVGLALLATAAALATLVAAVQAIGRVFRAERDDILILRSLGMRRRDLVAAGAGIGTAAGALASVLAVAIGIFASRWVPTGTAGQLEPLGLRTEPGLLILGAVLVALAMAVAGGLVALRVASHAPGAGRAQPAVAAGPLPIRLGVHWAFSRATPGPATGAARAALVAVVVGLAGITALVSFAASLDQLIHTPRLYGWDFDGGFKSFEIEPAEFRAKLRSLPDDPRVDELAWGSIIDVPVDGSALELFALDQARGVLHPSVIAGRAPAGADEIALGTETLSRLDARIGSRVRVGKAQIPFRVVGRAVYPELGNSQDLANTGSITYAGMERIKADPVISFALFRTKPGASAKVVIKRFHEPGVVDGGTPLFPSRVKNLKEVGTLPWLMAGFLAVLALTAVGHALVLSVRARRHDLAVLRAIGAVRSQLAYAVWSQATLTVLVGAVIAIPIGIAIGRQAWTMIADGLGVVNSPIIDVLLVVGAVAGTLAVANLVATGPALIASRLRPAAVLRSE